jgi:hypothetical protein
MSRLRLFGLLVAVVAVFSVAVAVVSSASGATMELPQFSASASGTSTSGPGTLFGATEIECTKDKGLQGAISNTLGTYDLNFEECTTLVTAPCHSLGQAAGSKIILTTGQYHLLLTGGPNGGGMHQYLLWLLVAELHLECEVLSTLVVVKGNVLGQIIGESETKFSVGVSGTKGGQNIKEYENNNGTLVAAEGLLAALNEGTFKASFENSTGSLITAVKTKLEK